MTAATSPTEDAPQEHKLHVAGLSASATESQVKEAFDKLVHGVLKVTIAAARGPRPRRQRKGKDESTAATSTESPKSETPNLPVIQYAHVYYDNQSKCEQVLGKIGESFEIGSAKVRVSLFRERQPSRKQPSKRAGNGSSQKENNGAGASSNGAAHSEPKKSKQPARKRTPRDPNAPKIPSTTTVHVALPGKTFSGALSEWLKKDANIPESGIKKCYVKRVVAFRKDSDAKVEVGEDGKPRKPKRLRTEKYYAFVESTNQDVFKALLALDGREYGNGKIEVRPSYEKVPSSADADEGATMA